MFTDTAANAKLGVNVGLLESNLKRDGILRLRRFYKRQFTVNLKTAGRIGDDPAGSWVCELLNHAKIVSGCILAGNQRIGFKFDFS